METDVLSFVRHHSMRTASQVRLKMSRGISLLATISATAPLLGAVAVSIAVMRGLSRPDPSFLQSAVISLTLFALSLVIAVVANFLYRFFRDRLDHMDLEMKIAGIDLVDRLSLWADRRT